MINFPILFVCYIYDFFVDLFIFLLQLQRKLYPAAFSLIITVTIDHLIAERTEDQYKWTSYQSRFWTASRWIVFLSSLFMPTCVQKLWSTLIWSCKEHIESKYGSRNAVHNCFAPECLTDEVKVLDIFSETFTLKRLFVVLKHFPPILKIILINRQRAEYLSRPEIIVKYMAYFRNQFLN